jgi:hypothetical protein
MTEKEKNKIGMFVDELDLLLQRFNLGIGGCGCCGSPFIFDFITDDVVAENLNLKQEEDKYTYKLVEKK